MRKNHFTSTVSFLILGLTSVGFAAPGSPTATDYEINATIKDYALWNHSKALEYKASVFLCPKKVVSVAYANADLEANCVVVAEGPAHRTREGKHFPHNKMSPWEYLRNVEGDRYCSNFSDKNHDIDYSSKPLGKPAAESDHVVFSLVSFFLARHQKSIPIDQAVLLFVDRETSLVPNGHYVYVMNGTDYCELQYSPGATRIVGAAAVDPFSLMLLDENSPQNSVAIHDPEHKTVVATQIAVTYKAPDDAYLKFNPPQELFSMTEAARIMKKRPSQLVLGDMLRLATAYYALPDLKIWEAYTSKARPTAAAYSEISEAMSKDLAKASTTDILTDFASYYGPAMKDAGTYAETLKQKAIELAVARDHGSAVVTVNTGSSPSNTWQEKYNQMRVQDLQVERAAAAVEGAAALGGALLDGLNSILR